MKITKQKEFILLKNEDGEYHLSHEKFKSLGKEKAIEFAKSEIDKKKNSTYNKKTITLKDARDLGFCEYGIKDFCKELNLDITKEYKLSFLLDHLTLKIVNKYQDECVKLFGKDIFKPFGGIRGYLGYENSSVELALKYGNIPDNILHLMACDFAYSCLHIFEERYLKDKRPRLAIEAKLNWLEGKITDKELDEARQSAYASYASAYASASASASYASASYASASAPYASASASYASSASASYAYAYASASASAPYASASASYASSASASERAKQKEYIIFMLDIYGVDL